MPRKERPIPVPKYWCYELGGGWQVWAGKTDEDNDLVTFTCGRPDDLWFHASAVPGSHVLLKAPEGCNEAPTREMIHAAAAIAAYHSKARESGKVSVCYTKVRCVGKEPKAKAGTVVISHETILKVAPTLPDGQNA